LSRFTARRTTTAHQRLDAEGNCLHGVAVPLVDRPGARRRGFTQQQQRSFGDRDIAKPAPFRPPAHRTPPRCPRATGR